MKYNVRDINNGILETFTDRQKALDYLDEVRREGVAAECEIREETGYSYAQILERVNEFVFLEELPQTAEEKAAYLIGEFEDYVNRYSTARKIKALGREFTPAHALFLVDKEFYLSEFETFVCESEDESEWDDIFAYAAEFFAKFNR